MKQIGTKQSQIFLSQKTAKWRIYFLTTNFAASNDYYDFKNVPFFYFYIFLK